MQLGGGLIFTLDTISSRLAALPPTVPVTRFGDGRLFDRLPCPAPDGACSPSLRSGSLQPGPAEL